MSKDGATGWLQSFKNEFEDRLNIDTKKAVTISVASGKGGVGKTSVSVKLAQILAGENKKVLLIDCDFNLSNTSVKLGLPINNKFYSLMNSNIDFKDCIQRIHNFDLLSGCNGHLDLFDDDRGVEKVVIDIIGIYENEYDYIILDSPAGISKSCLTLNAYSDFRFVVVTPDKSSITDSYSLIKVLNKKYGINDNHIIVNKVENNVQYQRIVKSLIGTIDNFLNCRVNILGGINLDRSNLDNFDQMLLNSAGSIIHNNFINLVRNFVEEKVSSGLILTGHGVQFDKKEPNLQQSLS